MGLDSDLTGALRQAARSLSLKDLRKQKVDRVRVIDRAQFFELLERVESRRQSQLDEADKKRLERLIQENERLGHDKKGLEHAKGLAEAERSRIQAELEELAQELGRETGQKATPEDVKALLGELRRLREDAEKAKKTLDRLQQQAQARLDQELTRSQGLKQVLEQSTIERERLQAERDVLEEEQEAFRQELEQFRGERDKFREERDTFREERDKFREERDRSRKERDGYLLSCTNLGQERDELRERLAELEQHRATFQALERELQEKDAQNAAFRAQVEGLEAELEQVKQELEQEKEQAHAARPFARPAPSGGDERLRRPAGSPAAFGFGFGFPGGKGV